MPVLPCTDCGKPVGSSHKNSCYLRCYGCQIKMNRLLYDRSRPAADELERRIEVYSQRLAAGEPLFDEPGRGAS